MSAEPQLTSSNDAFVRVDHVALATARARDGKFSLAESVWCTDNSETATAPFVADMRRLFHPDPVHVVDTTPENVLAWRIIDFDRHPFVLEGDNAVNLCLGAIRQAPARIAAEQTYAVVVAERLPACFIVAMGTHVYQRAMFPFFDRNGHVTRVATLIRPLTPDTPHLQP